MDGTVPHLLLPSGLIRVLFPQAAKGALLTEDPYPSSTAAVVKGAVTYLARRPSERKTPEGGKLWEFGLIGHVPGSDELAAKVAVAIRAWDLEYRDREVTFEIQPLDAPAIEYRAGLFALDTPLNRSSSTGADTSRVVQGGCRYRAGGHRRLVRSHVYLGELMDPRGSTAQRSPLVARFRPACLPLTKRVHALVDVADTAVAETDQRVASSVCNQAALIASDLGLPGLGREMCQDLVPPRGGTTSRWSSGGPGSRVSREASRTWYGRLRCPARPYHPRRDWFCRGARGPAHRRGPPPQDDGRRRRLCGPRGSEAPLVHRDRHGPVGSGLPRPGTFLRPRSGPSLMACAGNRRRLYAPAAA